MEFQSDYSKIKHFVENKDIGELEFSIENDKKQFGGAESCGQFGGAEGCGQFGGASVTNMLDNLDGFEKDFFEIFQKAKEYRHRINNSLNNMSHEMRGGEGAKPKRKTPALFAILHATAKKLREDPRVKQLLADKKLKNTDMLAIGGLILKDAKKIVADRNKTSVDGLKSTDANLKAKYDNEIKNEYEKLEKNYMKYVDQRMSGRASKMARPGHRLYMNFY